MNEITVSVFMLTYNQEEFIAQAIESILNQKTNFKYQLVIGEDCSSDNTRNICESYSNQNQSKIKLLPPLKDNIGLIANYSRTIKECNGKYIAICDGDDYWIDEFKLQKQVDFLEKNTDYSIVYTEIQKLFPNGELVDSYTTNQYKDSSFDDLVFLNFIPSVSVLFKNIQGIEEIPSWITKHPYGDWPTYLWTIKNGGKIHYINEITAVYRFDIGVSSKILDFNEVDISILNDMLNDISFISKKRIILQSINKQKLNIVFRLNKNKNYFKAFQVFLKLFIKSSSKYYLIEMYLFSIKKSLFQS